MKRFGMLCALLTLGAFTLFAQDTSSSTTTTNNGNTSTTTTTTSTNDNPGHATSSTGSSSERDAAQDATEKTDRQAHKDAAQADENAADQHKANAKEAGTKSEEVREKAEARLDDSAKVLNELLGAGDNGIPDEVFKSAKCVAVVPSMVKGGFVFGAEHGKGVATCRTANGWSAPAFFTITGGSWGAQIGGQAIDLVMLFMTEEGAKHLLDAKFNLGGDASVAAGPVGRDASANTDWKFKTGVLTYSRTRGIFAGVSLKGAVIRQDDDSTIAFYKRNVNFREVLTGQVQNPRDSGAERFIATVRREKKAATSNQ